ncbi:MAG TPA: hypothetical protein VGG25_16995 [Streptosporangiaceae bacterium]
MALTAQPWAIPPDAMAGVRAQGLDEAQVETAIGVIAMFNYFTRVADATGIEFDYLSPLPAFEPDRCQVTAARPADPGEPGPGPRLRPRHGLLPERWEAWRSYVLEAAEPIGPRERRLLAGFAAREATDWAGAAAIGEPGPAADGATADGRAAAADETLVAFARKLSREPWQMTEADLAGLRDLGYSEPAVLHMISAVAHQNADSRLTLGLAAATRK